MTRPDPALPDVGSHSATVSRRERIAMLLFTAACGVMYAVWAAKIPYNHAPDEAMRYVIVEYIVRHGTLPSGLDPAIRDGLWGTSYAFQPILNYMVGAGFAIVSGWLGGGAAAQLFAARLASVLCGLGTVAVCVTLGRHFFVGPWRWLFPVVVGLLPQFAFLSAYVNNDSLGLFSSALVVLAWVRVLRAGWSIRNGLLLGVALAVCSLSYFNAYGFILLSVVLCLAERILAWRESVDRRQFWRTTGLAVGVVVGAWVVLASWWFIRNGILYDGDLLGLASSNASIEKYGHPSIQANAHSGQSKGYTLLEMLFLRTWLIATGMSAVGMFGYQDKWISGYSYVFYAGMGVVSAAGWVPLVLRTMPRWRGRLTSPGESPVLGWLTGGRRILLLGVFVAAIIIPWVLSIHRSYYQDIQKQGRYILPMLIPMAFFVVWGFAWLVERFAMRWRTWIVAGLVAALTVIVLQAFTVAIR
ncbi:MAG TPA: hypothetical protein PLG38_05135 [Propionibacteriaceae bacterium]|nr:hypothetical protein [Propionibacteriaceae bacterium]HQE31389.1 hypothetical protein [Propionibacteriaceae bacterium]